MELWSGPGPRRRGRRGGRCRRISLRHRLCRTPSGRSGATCAQAICSSTIRQQPHHPARSNRPRSSRALQRPTDRPGQSVHFRPGRLPSRERSPVNGQVDPNDATRGSHGEYSRYPGVVPTRNIAGPLTEPIEGSSHCQATDIGRRDLQRRASDIEVRTWQGLPSSGGRPDLVPAGRGFDDGRPRSVAGEVTLRKPSTPGGQPCSRRTAAHWWRR